MNYILFKCNYTTYYEVVKEKDNFYAIYLNDGAKRFITHKETWKQATKLAKMLSEAYVEGVSSQY